MALRDSGERQVFSTGAQRDTAKNKPDLTFTTTGGLYWLLRQVDPDLSRDELMDQLIDLINTKDTTRHYDINPSQEGHGLGHDLIPQIALNRLAVHLEEGAKKYSPRNWERGMPLSRYYASALRHLIQWANGDTQEDHLAAVLFNVAAIIFTEYAIYGEKLPDELGDLGFLKFSLP